MCVVQASVEIVVAKWWRSRLSQTWGGSAIFVDALFSVEELVVSDVGRCAVLELFSAECRCVSGE